MKTSNVIFSTLFAFVSLLGINTSAQNEGIPNWQNLVLTGMSGGSNVYSQNVVGFANGGAGFAFSPNVSLDVTALGFGGSDLANSPYVVALFNAGGNPLASATVTLASSFYNQTYYQPITPIVLTAGQTYYIQAAEGPTGPSPGIWTGDLSTVFSVNSDISYLSGSTGGFGSAPSETNPLSPGTFLSDENFEFTVVPEPSVLALSAAGLLGLGISWRKRRS